MKPALAKAFVRTVTVLHILLLLALAAGWFLLAALFTIFGSVDWWYWLSAVAVGAAPLVIIGFLVGVFLFKPWARIPGLLIAKLSIVLGVFFAFYVPPAALFALVGVLEIWLLNFDEAAKALFARTP